MSAAVAGTQTLTWDNAVAVADGEQVLVGGVTYTGKTALTSAAALNEVLLNGGGDGFLTNLSRALNHTGTPGTDYGSLTLKDPNVSASAVAAHAITLTARHAGAIPAVALSTTSAHLAFGAATLTGGTDSALANTTTASAADAARIGALTETAPATDTASSGLNGRLQRIAQRLTSLIALLPGFGTAAAPSANVVTAQRPSVTQVMDAALAASKVLKNAAGQLVQLSVFNSKASAQYILLMNSATVPADGAVSLLYPPIPIAAVTILVLDFPAPLVASTGIAVCNSSTGSFTKTIGSADCVFFAQVN